MIKESVNLNGPETTKCDSLGSLILLILISMQKISVMGWFLPEILMINEFFTLTGWKTFGYTQPKMIVSDPSPNWLLFLCKKYIALIDCLHKCWWSMIGWQAQLPTLNQNGTPKYILSLMVIPHLKNLLHQLVASRDQGILKSDRMIGANPNTQPKEVVSDPSFCWRLSPYKKSRVLIDSLLRCWWPKNPGIRLDKRHNWQHPTKTGSLRSFLPLMVISK